MRGQGIVEYIFVLVLVAVALIVFLVLLGPTVNNIIRDNQNVCRGTFVECQLARVDECMATERLTEDQCVRLVGGK